MKYERGMYFIKTNKDGSSYIAGVLLEPYNDYFNMECWHVGIIHDHNYGLYSEDGKHGVIVIPSSGLGHIVNVYDSYEKLIAAII